MFKSIWLFLNQYVWVLGVDKHWLETRFTNGFGVNYGVGLPVVHCTSLIKKALRNTRLQLAYDKAHRNDPFRWRNA